MIKTIHTLLALFLLSSLVACGNDELQLEDSSNDSQELIYKLVLDGDTQYNRPQSRSYTDKTPTDNIENIDVLIFESAGSANFLYQAEARKINSSTNQYEIRLKRSKDNAPIDVVVVANPKKYIDTNSFENYQQFIQTATYPTEELSSMNDLPMLGIYKSLDITTKRQLNVSLTRSVAKFSLTLAAAANSQFNLETIHIYDLPSNIRIGYQLDKNGEPQLPNAEPKTLEYKRWPSIQAKEPQNISYLLPETEPNTSFIILEGHDNTEGRTAFYRLNLPEIKRNFNYIIEVSQFIHTSYKNIEDAINGVDSDYQVITFSKSWVKQAYYSKGLYFGIDVTEIYFPNTGFNIIKELKVETNIPAKNLSYHIPGNAYYGVNDFNDKDLKSNKIIVTRSSPTNAISGTELSFNYMPRVTVNDNTKITMAKVKLILENKIIQ